MNPLRSLLFLLLLAAALLRHAAAITLSSRLIHRFSDDAKPLASAATSAWPQRYSMDYYHLLFLHDFRRQKLKLGGAASTTSNRRQFQFLFPSEGSNTASFGNDFGWLHYTWIDIGTPNLSFLVALDTGSDLLWVPCDCLQCAPLSAAHYSTLDRELNEYSLSGSSTSKHVACGHELCTAGAEECKDGPKQPCPYNANYTSENTTSSGLLVEDILQLGAGGTGVTKKSVRAPVIMGCGMKQSGGYLDGIAPDGLMGLGPGDISVPSFLAKAGLIKNSFSMCVDDEDSGRIFFGDQGPSTQQSTSFLMSNGKYETYIIGVEACCIGNSCLMETKFKALIDSGTSFTFLPEEVYDKIAVEFDKRMNATITSYEGSPWKYCYKTSSQDLLKVPSLTLMFLANNSFVVHDPIFRIYDDQGIVGICLAIQPADDDIGTIGQNFMSGYRIVFDRENMKLGWSRSKCEDLGDAKSMPLTPSPKGTSPIPLPTTEQQSTPGGFAPAVAGRAMPKASAASSVSRFSLLRWFSQLVFIQIVFFFVEGYQIRYSVFEEITLVNAEVLYPLNARACLYSIGLGCYVSLAI